LPEEESFVVVVVVVVEAQIVVFSERLLALVGRVAFLRRLVSNGFCAVSPRQGVEPRFQMVMEVEEMPRARRSHGAGKTQVNAIRILFFLKLD